MSTRELLTQLTKLVEHPETPFYVTNSRSLDVGVALRAPEATKEYKTMIGKLARSVDEELRSQYGELNQEVTKALRRNGYNIVPHTTDKVPGKYEIVYPGNQLRFSVG